VLVTGAGGFIGAEMVRLLARAGARQVVLLDIAEQALFRIHAEMTAREHGDRCAPVLGSVCDRGLLRELFEEHRPELVLHAAALKHVPLMELNPLAAMETNALGTWRLAQAAEAHGARALILVSTDKAVVPRSIMGAAKRIAELAMLAPTGHGRMRCAAVRLANVIGSPCSVGPLFHEQIASGGPVTVTHPEAKRFFLTLAEVTALLAQAIDCDSADGVLIPDPVEPIRIAELARRMIEASGRNVPITFTRLRPGDKLEESLIGPDERDAGPATPGLRHLRAVLRATEELAPDYQPSAMLRESLPEMAQP
jgi:FlaA1/EpsC-like NDP-sugar epimerase